MLFTAEKDKEGKRHSYRDRKKYLISVCKFVAG
jgi:hypothetical protein